MSNPRGWSVQCIVDWLKIREQEGMPFPPDRETFERELDNSALLRRLMEGKQPLPSRPPLSFGHPWYKLAEDGSDVAMEVKEAAPGQPAILINRHIWHLIDRISDAEFVVSYGSSPDLFRCYSSGEDATGTSVWHLSRLSPQA